MLAMTTFIYCLKVNTNINHIRNRGGCKTMRIYISSLANGGTQLHHHPPSHALVKTFRKSTVGAYK